MARETATAAAAKQIKTKRNTQKKLKKKSNTQKTQNKTEANSRSSNFKRAIRRPIQGVSICIYRIYAERA